MGPYQNRDTYWEDNCAMGVIKWEISSFQSFDNLVNQPSSGFYIKRRQSLIFDFYPVWLRRDK